MAVYSHHKLLVGGIIKLRCGWVLLTIVIWTRQVAYLITRCTRVWCISNRCCLEGIRRRGIMTTLIWRVFICRSNLVKEEVRSYIGICWTEVKDIGDLKVVKIIIRIVIWILLSRWIQRKGESECHLATPSTWRQSSIKEWWKLMIKLVLVLIPRVLQTPRMLLTPWIPPTKSQFDNQDLLI